MQEFVNRFKPQEQAQKVEAVEQPTQMDTASADSKNLEPPVEKKMKMNSR